MRGKHKGESDASNADAAKGLGNNRSFQIETYVEAGRVLAFRQSYHCNRLSRSDVSSGTAFQEHYGSDTVPMPQVHSELRSIIAITDTPKRSINERPKRLIKIQLSNDRISKVDAILRNVTERGAGVELKAQLQQGEKVWIKIKNLEPFSGTVAWSKNHRAGLEFDEPIDPSLLTIKNCVPFTGEGMFKNADGYHVFDRFKPVTDVKRPPLKPRK